MKQDFPGWTPIFTGRDMEAQMLQPILEQNKIPCEIISEHGRAFTMQAGSILESYSVYVPDPYAEQAADLVKAYIQQEE